MTVRPSAWEQAITGRRPLWFVGAVVLLGALGYGIWFLWYVTTHVPTAS